VASGNITVGNNGKDFKSIQEATNNATDGDVIQVYPGTYTENVYIDREVTIVSYSGNPEDTVVTVEKNNKHVFTVNADNVTINGFKITGAVTDEYGEDMAGVYFYNKSGIAILNNNITENNIGISAVYANNNVIKKNTLIRNTLNGIFLWSSNNNLLINNIVKSAKNEGIFLFEGGYANSLIGNSVSGANTRIEQYSDYNQYSDNTLIDNTATGNTDGFLLVRADNFTFKNNTANSNHEDGIFFAISKNNLLANNTANGNGKSGFFVHRVINSSFVGNTAIGNTEYGIILSDYSTNNILKQNNATDNGKGNFYSVEEGNRIINQTINSSNNTRSNHTTNNTGSDGSHHVPLAGGITTVFVVIAAYLRIKRKEKPPLLYKK
jgi:parallel beta-helix repeat protein